MLDEISWYHPTIAKLARYMHKARKGIQICNFWAHRLGISY